MKGAELRRIRLQLGLTQEEMAQRLDLSRTSLGRYETDARRIPRTVELSVRWVAEHERAAGK